MTGLLFSLLSISKEMANVADPVIAEAYRGFLAKNLTGPRCSEGFGDETIRVVIADFNSRFAGGLPPLKLEDLKASKVERWPRQFPASQAMKLTSCGRSYGRSTWRRGAELSDVQKNTPEWREQFASLLHDIDDMKPATGESEACVFRSQGAALYSLDRRWTPPGSSRDQVLQQYIAFVKASNFQEESPVEWFSQVESLVSQTRSMGEAEYGKVLDALERSGNSVLYIYARLQKLLPTAPSWAQTFAISADAV